MSTEFEVYSGNLADLNRAEAMTRILEKQLKERFPDQFRGDASLVDRLHSA